MPQSSSARRGSAASFESTHWSLVVAAGRSSSAESREALERLCDAYWYPIYAHLRRSGHDPHTAQDLTQAFFTRVLEKRVLSRADRERGRFRSFLLASLRNFLSNQRDHDRAQKRGGERRTLTLDFDSAEGRYRLEPVHAATPESAFERQWALAVLEQALSSLEAQYRASRKVPLFTALVPFLAGEGDAAGYGNAADALGMTAAAVKMAATRLRRRYREQIRAEIARTVASPDEVEDELRRLFAALTAP